MTGTPRIVSLEAGTADSNDILELDQPVDEATGWDAPPGEAFWEEPPPLARDNWAMPALAAALTLGWTGF